MCSYLYLLNISYRRKHISYNGLEEKEEADEAVDQVCDREICCVLRLIEMTVCGSQVSQPGVRTQRPVT